MEPAHVVLLIAVVIAVVAIAGYLIAIAVILKRVVERLVTILGAVEAVTETALPVGAIVDDINRDLDAGRKLLENGVARLEENRAPAGATADQPRHGAAEPASGPGGGGTATVAPPPPAAASTKADPPWQAPPKPRRG